MTYFDEMSGRGAVAVASDGSDPALRATSRTYPIVREFLRLGTIRKNRSFLARTLGVNPLPSASRALYRGALGEIAVSDALAQLGPGWVVLDSVPVAKDGGDVDHVVIGPCGVYTIAVRNHAGRAIWVGGAVVLDRSAGLRRGRGAGAVSDISQEILPNRRRTDRAPRPAAIAPIRP